MMQRSEDNSRMTMSAPIDEGASKRARAEPPDEAAKPAPEIAVIIPTLAVPERAFQLRRAVDSVAGQSGVRAIPIVVVNGTRFDADVVRELQSSNLIKLLRLEDADLPSALQAGRKAVDAAWFATLDDDDFLLPDALSSRRAALLAAPHADVVISNGLVARNDGQGVHIADVDAVSRDPLGTLFQRNWLLPGSWLARSERVGPDLFDAMPRFLECTFLAIQFSTRYRSTFLPTPTVWWNAAAVDADHLSQEALLGMPEAIEKLLRNPLPRRARRGLRQHLASAHHSCTDHFLRNGDLRSAWRYHWRTMTSIHGLRHWPMSIRILLGLVRS